MAIPDENTLIDEFSRYYSNKPDIIKIRESIDYYKLILKLREIGEYNAAVEYLSKSIGEQNEKERAFSAFCDDDFFCRQSEEQKIAFDITEIVFSLTDERNFVFSAMRSHAGKILLDRLNQSYACPRGLRYNAIWRVISGYREANIVDVACGEARLEEHCNILNKQKSGVYRFHVADRSSYILLQAKYRNRNYKNIRYYYADFSGDFSPEIFRFGYDAPLISVVSEFIEHLSKKEGIALLKRIIGEIRPSELLVTTPNRDFSVVYKTEDPNNRVHVYEYPYREFVDTMRSLEDYSKGSYRLGELYGIAGIDGLPQSLFARLTLNRGGNDE